MSNGPLPDHKRHRIAASTAAGMPVDLIAKAVGESVETVQRQIRDPSPSMQTLIEHYRFQQNATLVKFKMETAEIVDEGLKFINGYVRDGTDARLRYEMTKDILSAHGLIFPRDRAAAPQVNTQLNVYTDNRTIQAFEDVAKSIHASTEALGGALGPVGDVLKSRHISVSEADITSAPVPVEAPKDGNGSDQS